MALRGACHSRCIQVRLATVSAALAAPSIDAPSTKPLFPLSFQEIDELWPVCGFE